MPAQGPAQGAAQGPHAEPARSSNKALVLQGKHVAVRPVRLEDALDLAPLANDPEIAAHTLQIPHPYTLDDANRFVLAAHLQMREGSAYVFAITLRGSDTPIGIIGLGGFRETDRRAEVGFWIGREFWNRGYVTEALTLVVEFSFGRLNLHKVEGEVFAWNAASCRVFEKCGFKHEGTRRDHRYKQGQWITCEIYGRVADE